MAMSDWNDKKNGANMTLSTLQAHGGSKSLKTICLNSDQVIKILTQSETDSPTHVNIDTWLWFHAPVSYSAIFTLFLRYQDLNNYFVANMVYNTTFAKFYMGKYVAGVITWENENLAIPITVNTWEHWKLMFCSIAGICYMLLYKEEAGEWVLKHERSMSESWAAGGAVGVGAFHDGGSSANTYEYLDDTKICYV